VISAVSKPYFELYSPVRNDATKFQLRRQFAVKIGAVQIWLKTQIKTFCSDGIKKVVKRLNWCVEVDGDYVEK
jgi:hypothetical protein